MNAGLSIGRAAAGGQGGEDGAGWLRVSNIVKGVLGTGGIRKSQAGGGVVVGGSLLLVCGSAINDQPPTINQTEGRREGAGRGRIINYRITSLLAHLKSSRTGFKDYGEYAILFRMTGQTATKLVFNKRPLKDETILGGLIHKKNPENALIKLINALADAGDAREVTEANVGAISADYKLDLHAKFRVELDDYYRKYILLCLSDRKFSEDEVTTLWHLKSLFAISDSRHDKIYEEVGQEVYRRTIRAAVADSQITEKERAFLKQVQIDLELPEAVAEATRRAETTAILEEKAEHLLAQRLLSPENEKELYSLARELGANLTLGDDLRRRLARCRLMWEVRIGNPPTIEAGINLKRGEKCYLSCHVDWYEMRKVRYGVAYAGPTLRVKIAKGLYWRMGAFGGAPISNDELQKIDSGVVYLTNMRILFTGALKNTAIRLDKIIDINSYSDGVGIQKDTGKSPVLCFKGDIEMFCAVLARAIDDFNKEDEDEPVPDVEDREQPPVDNNYDYSELAAEDPKLIARAIEIIRQTRRASTSCVQRMARIGYTKAARIIDILEENHLVGPPRGAEAREILFDVDAGVDVSTLMLAPAPKDADAISSEVENDLGLVVQGVNAIRKEHCASVSVLQSEMKIDAGHAQRILNKLERFKLVGPSRGDEAREIIGDLDVAAKALVEMSSRLNSTDLPVAPEEDEEIIQQAIEVIRQTRRASTSSIQRRLRIGYTRAARIIDILEEKGLLGPPRGSEAREILFDLDK